MSSFVCGVCEGTSGDLLIEAPAYPAYLVPMPREAARKVVRAPLKLMVCPRCGHMQQPTPDAELQRLIYAEYYSNYVVDAAEALVPHYRQPFDAFVAELAKSGQLPRGSLLEIGCSSGERVGFWEQYASSYTGIDPSTRIELARERHPKQTFIHSYFPPAPAAKQFDVVVSQFNLEHVLDAPAFVEAVFGCTREGSLLVVQVPDIEAFERTAQPNFLAHEHVHYFRQEQLALLLARHGFEVIRWGAEGPSLICAARRTGTRAGVTPGQDATRAARRHAELFKLKPALPEGALLFYGVGPLLYWMLQGMGDRSFAVVDDNPAYRGQGLPGYDAGIEPLSPQLLQRFPKVVLSLNPIYHPRVMERLRASGAPVEVCSIREGSWGVTRIP